MIVVHTTKEQVLDLIEHWLPFRYDSQGNKTQTVPAWLLVLLYMSTPVSANDIDATDTILQG